MKNHLERMAFVIELARKNIRRGGGPFGAAVFDLKSGRCLGSGVNRVIAANDPTNHAEINAIRAACRTEKSFRLHLKGRKVALYISAEPCGMCTTALVWTGISEVYYGAEKVDIERIGFDEGLKPRAWKRALKRRGISVAGGLMRKEAAALLLDYQRLGRPIYNGLHT